MRKLISSSVSGGPERRKGETSCSMERDGGRKSRAMSAEAGSPDASTACTVTSKRPRSREAPESSPVRESRTPVGRVPPTTDQLTGGVPFST